MITLRNGTLRRAIEAYLGTRVMSVQAVPDPNLPAVALRAFVSRGRTVDFLVTNTPLQQVTKDDLEEVQFTAWPPTVR